MLRALLWDVDGTLAETERDGHRLAFNLAFADLALPWSWSEQRYGELLAVTGGRERLLHAMQAEVGAPSDPAARYALAEQLHRRKNEHYAAIVARGAIALRAGVRELILEAGEAGVTLGIVTTTSRANVEALLRVPLGERWRERFAVLVCGEDAPQKKPDPLAYRLALKALALHPAQVLAVEDSPAGVAAAAGAAVPVIVTRSVYFEAASFAGARAVGPSLGDGRGWTPAPVGPGRIDLAQLRRWHATPGPTDHA